MTELLLTPDLPGTGGQIKVDVADFVVDELPAYLPEGAGDHLFVRIRKTDLNTEDVARRIAETMGFSAGQVGFAGRKDRRAVTTQWLSIPGSVDEEKLAAIEGDGLEVLEVSRHRNKLKTGHLHGNRFRVVIRGPGPDAEARARAVLDRIEREGMPNGFGPQRFGFRGQNPAQALGWIVHGRRAPRDRRKRQLLISSLQALLFNRILAHRIATGSLVSALDGDIMKLRTTGGLFVVEDVEVARERSRAREISATGPMYGSKLWWAEREAGELERQQLLLAGLNEEHLAGFRKDGPGARRVLRLFPADLQLEASQDSLILSFSLDAGAFATALLAEVMKTPELLCPVELTTPADSSPHTLIAPQRELEVEPSVGE